MAASKHRVCEPKSKFCDVFAGVDSIVFGTGENVTNFRQSILYDEGDGLILRVGFPLRVTLVKSDGGVVVTLFWQESKARELARMDMHTFQQNDIFCSRSGRRGDEALRIGIQT